MIMKLWGGSVNTRFDLTRRKKRRGLENERRRFEKKEDGRQSWGKGKRQVGVGKEGGGTSSPGSIPSLGEDHFKSRTKYGEKTVGRGN